MQRGDLGESRVTDEIWDERKGEGRGTVQKGKLLVL
jgi:hypothetical protein